MTTTAEGTTDTSTDHWSWVLIETGSNQQFIFDTNRRRYAVGASELIKQVATWVTDAVDAELAQGSQINPVVVTSSMALLQVADPTVGQRIVQAVTTQAATAAPGLDLWGYVEPTADAQADVAMARLAHVHARHAEQRWLRAQPLARAPLAPFLEACNFTGRAATSETTFGDTTVPASSQAQKVLAAAGSALKSMQQDLSTAPPPPTGVSQPSKELTADQLKSVANAVVDTAGTSKSGGFGEQDGGGWVALIHADGNTVGEVIRQVISPAEYATFSSLLTWATRSALQHAISDVLEALDEEPKAWLLPLIVGGDDVTLLCEGRFAVKLTAAYLTHFERFTGASPAASPAIQRSLGRTYLTASAGIAITKPKYPYWSAYHLADQLAREAKTGVKNHARERSSYSFHILRDSVVRDLPEMRPNPQQFAGAASPVAMPLLAPAGFPSSSSSTWVAAHEDGPVIAQADAMLTDGHSLSAGEIRRMREAATEGRGAMEATKTRFAARAIAGGDDPFLLAGTGAQQITLWPAVLDLVDVARGTATRRSAR